MDTSAAKVESSRRSVTYILRCICPVFPAWCQCSHRPVFGCLMTAMCNVERRRTMEDQRTLLYTRRPQDDVHLFHGTVSRHFCTETMREAHRVKLKPGDSLVETCSSHDAWDESDHLSQIPCRRNTLPDLRKREHKQPVIDLRTRTRLQRPRIIFFSPEPSQEPSSKKNICGHLLQKPRRFRAWSCSSVHDTPKTIV